MNLKKLVKRVLIDPSSFKETMSQDLIFAFCLTLMVSPYYVFVSFICTLLRFLGIDKEHVDKYKKVMTVVVMFSLLVFYSIMFVFLSYIFILSGILTIATYLFFVLVVSVFFISLCIVLGSSTWLFYSKI